MSDAPIDPGMAGKQLPLSGESRRSFLTKTAALAGAAAVAGPVFGRSTASQRLKPTVKERGVNPPKPGETIRMAIIGIGGMGGGHAHAFCSFAKDEGLPVELVAVNDVNEVRLDDAIASLKDRWGVECDRHTDYREILDREDIHAVLIASPEHWHAQHIIDAITAGKDVYTEKPMTLNLDQAMQVREVVLGYPDRIFQVGTQGIMQGKYNAAKKAIADGVIGKPVWSQTSYCRNAGSDGEWNYYALDDRWEPGVNVDWRGWLGYMPYQEWDPKVYARWRRYKDFSTGIVGDLLVHVMTPMIFALDLHFPTRVVACGSHVIDKEMENHDQVNLVIEYGNDDHQMVVAGSTANAVGLETMVRGHQANMYLNGRDVEIIPERRFVDDVERETIAVDDIGNDHNAMRKDWLECIHSRKPAKSNIDLASKVMVAVDLATRSMWEGGAFTFDEKTMKVARG
ncbi:MAG: Gfo/Idh/MocA family protein [Phycisphaerales bacterium JB040]